MNYVCDQSLAIKFLQTEKADEDLVLKLVNCPNPVNLLFGAIQELAMDYVLDEEIDYYLYKTFRFIHKNRDKLDLYKCFKETLENIGKYSGLRDVILSMIKALVNSGVSDLSDFLKNIPPEDLKWYEENAQDFISSLSKKLVKPKKSFEDFYDDATGYRDCFIKLGIPIYLVDKYLDSLIKMAVKAVYDFLEHIYWDSKAWYRLYEEGTSGVYERLLIGSGLDNFANEVLESTIPDQDKVLIAESIMDYIIENAYKLELCSFPFIKLLALKKKLGILQDEELIILYNIGPAFLRWKDPFIKIHDLQDIINYMAINLSGPEAALAFVSIITSSSKLPNRKINVVLNNEKIDPWTKITYSLTVLTLIKYRYSPRPRFDPEEYLYVLYSKEQDKLKEIVEKVLRKRILPDPFTEKLAKLLQHSSKIKTIKSYYHFLLKVIPEKMFNTKPPSEIDINETSARCALARIQAQYVPLSPPKWLIQQATSFLIRNIKDNKNLNLLITALEDTIKSLSYPESLLPTLIQAIAENIDKFKKTHVINKFEKYMQHAKYQVRYAALKALYQITGKPKYLKIALNDRAEIVKKWGEKELRKRKTKKKENKIRK